MSVLAADRPLRIAVCGRRFLPNPQSAARAIDQALEKIRAGCPGRDWIVLSPLAEGADQLVVERILHVQPAARLVVPLPVDEAAYLETFSAPAGRENFRRLRALAGQVITLPVCAARQEAFVQLSRYLVAQSDLLIAVWDGQPAGGPGGTGDTVRRARQAQRALAWIDSRGTDPAPLTFEHFLEG